MTTATRVVRVGSRTLPVFLPNTRDARLHTAAVIISIHTIGITALGFRVSVPQILSAILTAGVIDVLLTLRASGNLVWPASGMLTGSGVALILRLVGMDSGDYWSWTGWYWFSLVAAVSILTKYLIRYRGSHIFNPSNVGLVAAFVLIGSRFVEPLDFWWAPLGFWMIVAYVVIIGGGALITRRLHLLEMAGVFWLSLAGALAILAASGHCMIARWSPVPVCGTRFWTVLVTSPEILIFLFFMITDPKTIPRGRAARVAFAATLGLMTTLLIAPQVTEYGAKVGLLASLAIWSPLRWLFERLVADTPGQGPGLSQIVAGIGRRAPVGIFTRGLATGVLLSMVGLAIVLAGIPARSPGAAASVALREIPVEVDAASLPVVAVDDSVYMLDIPVDDEFVDSLAVTFAENLAIETEAIRTADGSLLALADGGERLDEMQANLDAAIATGERWANEYDFDTLSLRRHDAPEGQSSAGLVFALTGTADHVLYDTSGNEQVRDTEPIEAEFVLRQLAGDRWLIVDTGG